MPASGARIRQGAAGTLRSAGKATWPGSKQVWREPAPDGTMRRDRLQLLDENPGEAEIIRRAAEKGIGLFPFSATWATGEPASTSLLLGFGGMTVQASRRGDVSFAEALTTPQREVSMKAR